MSNYKARISRIEKKTQLDKKIILVFENPGEPDRYVCDGKEYTEAEYKAAFPDWKDHLVICYDIPPEPEP